MKKFKIQKIRRGDVYVRYWIAASLILIVLMGQLTGFLFYFLLLLAGLLLFTGIVEKSIIKSKFYPDK